MSFSYDDKNADDNEPDDKHPEHYVDPFRGYG
jgi:hypothetical protein